MDIASFSGAATVAAASTIAFAIAMKGWHFIARSFSAAPRFADVANREAAQRFRDELERLTASQLTYLSATVVFVLLFLSAHALRAERIYAGYPDRQLYLVIGLLTVDYDKREFWVQVVDRGPNVAAAIRVPYELRRRAKLRNADEPPARTGPKQPEPIKRIPVVYGRVGWWDSHNGYILVDARQGRFTWQSITGLIVGAIGIGVFAAALRKWLQTTSAT